MADPTRRRADDDPVDRVKKAMEFANKAAAKNPSMNSGEWLAEIERYDKITYAPNGRL